MKNRQLSILLSVVLLFICGVVYGQAGAVYTVAGGGTSMADGVPATSALLANTTGIATDAAGNIYFTSNGQYKIRKIDVATGNIYTVAGNGTSGSSGDGGQATAAQIATHRAIYVDGSGNIYIAEQGGKIRKVDAATGIITTVAGGGSLTTDGIPATNANLGEQLSVFVDGFGNIYCSGVNKVKKVNGSTGIITTVAGGGSSSSDGVPATNASISSGVKSISLDNAGNIYIISHSGTPIRKVDGATGLIYTIAGGGSSSADGIPATASSLSDAHSCKVDGAGNLFIADWSENKVKRVDAATGIINTIAGSGSAGSSTEGLPPLSSTVAPYQIALDPVGGYVYFTDYGAKVRRFSYSPIVPLTGMGGGSPGSYSSDSFYVNIYRQCGGPQFTVRTHAYHSGMTIRTFFGDGTSDTSTVMASWSGVGGYILTSCTYPASGAYSVKHVLCNYGTPVDSFSYSYNHVFCSEMSILFYNDADLNCTKDVTDNYLIKSTFTEIDSNSIPIDTIVSTSGFTYIAFGNPGDIYTFKVLSVPSGLYTSCPLSGVLYDTLFTGITENPVRYMAVSCVAPAMSDLQATAYVPVTGPNDQWGHIYVRNNGCLSSDASVTLNFSPKYRYTSGARPTPVSSTATSITWNLTGISDIDATPQDIYYVVWHNPAVPYPTDGDTVNEYISVTTTGGPADINMANNIVIRTDTVRTSCDPNAIEVMPSCFDNDTTFHFTVHFENIGSAPAENIYVMDTLSPYFDASTLDIDMSSHAMFISKYYVNGKTIFRFNFPNINLADSSDHENRDGMFMYTIKNRPGMTIGTSAFSRVGIYFDYNDVLMTNTVQNTKGCPSPTAITVSDIEADISLFPNPATSELTIKTELNAFTSLTITNTIGQQVLHQSMPQSQLKVSVKDLTPGIYYVTLKGEQGSEVRKFVKW